MGDTARGRGFCGAGKVAHPPPRSSQPAFGAAHLRILQARSAALDGLRALRRHKSRKGRSQTCLCWRSGLAVVLSTELGSGHNAPMGGLTLAGGHVSGGGDAAVGLHAVGGAAA
jgi:hypothetical protein